MNPEATNFAVLDCLPEPMLVIDPAFNVLYANRSARALISVLSDPPSFLDLLSDEVNCLPYLEQVFRSDSMIPGTIEIMADAVSSTWICSGGRIATTNTILLRLTKQSESSSQFLKLTQKLENLNVENNERRVAEAKFQAIIDGLPFGLRLVQDRDVVMTNLNFDRWFVPPPSLFCERQFLIENEDQQRHFVTDEFLVKTPGQSSLRCTIFTDVTETRRADEARERMQSNILHAQKLESLGVLAGGIAHDFNNLLVGMLGNSELALMDIAADSRARTYLKDVVLSAQRAAELCMQMLAYSGKGRFVVRVLDLNEIVREMLSLLKVSISKKAVLKTRLAAVPPLFEGDATQIRQILMNLITNASDALGDESGIITITTGVASSDASYLEQSTLSHELPEGDYAFVEVSDTGGGMIPETIERIFDPFFTTKPAGRGLGLAAVSGIIRGHRGAVRIHSESGRGTRFKVLLPALERSEVSESSPEFEVEIKHGSGVILIVDDEHAVRRVAMRVAERAGFSVLEAANGQEAVDIFRERHQEIALVLLDMSMPVMSGEEAFRILKTIDPSVPVVLSSGYNEQDATTYFVGKGLDGFLQKPYRPADLLKILHKS
jgi:signal transduction histidine kinase